MTSLILSTATRLITGLMLVFSVFLLLRGHNEPGGGFIGGLVAVIAFALYGKSRGTAEARRALYVHPNVLSLIGLGCAVAAGVVGMLFGEPFLTGKWLFVGGGDGDKGWPLSTILLFDIGVYLVVVGAVLSVIFAMEEEI